jgi:DNA-binding LacI/PurR family transcriptional regulator
MPTLDDVGRAAGVSRGTVSNVFNRPELVRPELRERVRAAAQALGFGGPDPKGRLLKEGKFNAIGFMPPGAYAIADVVRSPYGRELVLGAAQACDEAGATLSLVNGTDETRFASIRGALVDGFILGNSADIELIASARRRRLPFVILEADVGPDVNSIRIDGRGGALAVIRHLTGLGHRRFAILSIRRSAGPAIVHRPGETNRELLSGFALDHERLAAFRDGLAEAGLSIDDTPIIETTPGDPLAGAAVFDQCPEATAIVTMSDWQAITVLDEANRRHIDVPGAVSVTGFDGTVESARTSPPLTTVAHDIAGKARLAAEMILTVAAPRQVVMPVELLVRGSTAAPRGDELL